MALVEYSNSSEAKKAFKALAYTEFFDVPLFLEWAPVELWVNSKEKKETSESESKKMTTTIEDLKEEEIETVTSQSNPLSSTTLFVKNLSFNTTEKELKDHFGKYGSIRSCTIAKKKDMEDNGKLISAGYGFIEYEEKEDSIEAFKLLQGKLLDAHALEISFIKPKNTSSSSRKTESTRNKPSNKLIVKNVPFETNKKEIRKIFSTFGEIKSVRIPWKRGGGQHQGFAFVEFLTKEEAKNALETLSNSHFYGRHFIVDYSKEEEGIDEIRQKTKDIYEKSHN